MKSRERSKRRSLRKRRKRMKTYARLLKKC